MTAFTSYWTNDSWGINLPDQGRPLNHIAANDFRKRGVGEGDMIYVVTNLKGKMFLCARIPVDRFVTQTEAERVSGKRLWEAEEHVISDGGTPMRFDRQVPDAMVKSLRLGSEAEPLKFAQPGLLDNQTLRGVRRLSAQSAHLLDSLITDSVGSPDTSKATSAQKPSGKPKLAEVETLEQVAENFIRFQREGRSYQDRTFKIFRATSFWVRDTNSGAFGPAKFLGYQDMTFVLYDQARAGETTGKKFDGLISRKAVESVAGQVFLPNDEFADECRAWGEKMLGPHAFGGANSEKWKFIEIAIPGREGLTDFPDEVTQPEKYVEGASRTVTVNQYERNSKARAACIEHWGTKCRVCEMDFVAVYGEIGRGFIHVHHLNLLADIGEEYEVDPIADLRPVCPNCHSMLHQQTPPVEIDVLKKMLLPVVRR